MTELEDALSTMLKDLVPEPPHELDPRAAQRSRSRVARVGAPLAAAMVIVALAVTTVAIGRQHHRAGTGTTPPSVTSSAAMPPGEGRLSGRVLAVGGPYGARPIPHRGTVIITDIRSGRTRMATAGADGRYTVQLPAGTYSVEAHSPQMGTADTYCLAAGPVTLRPGSQAVSNAYCQMR